jgi:hypothetical protein
VIAVTAVSALVVPVEEVHERAGQQQQVGQDDPNRLSDLLAASWRVFTLTVQPGLRSPSEAGSSTNPGLLASADRRNRTTFASSRTWMVACRTVPLRVLSTSIVPAVVSTLFTCPRWEPHRRSTAS